MIEAIITFTFIFIIGYIIYHWTERISKRLNQKTERLFAQLGKNWNLNLTHQVKKLDNTTWFAPILTGEIESHLVKIFMIKKGHGDDISVYTVLEIQIPHGGIRFKLYPRSAIARFFIGNGNVPFKDKTFEKNFIVQSIHKQAVIQLFTEDIKQLLIKNKKDFSNGKLEFKDGKLVYEYPFQLLKGWQKKQFENIMKVAIRLVTSKE